MDIKKIWIALFFYIVPISGMSEVGQMDGMQTPHAEEHNSGGQATGVAGEAQHEEEEGVVRMDAANRAEVGIITAKIEKHSLSEEILVPGEVVINSYFSSKISPRISAQVVARHARLGDTVKQGQRMVTLSSVEMAQAQGELIVATREWHRVKKLGREVIAGRRYIQAQVASQQAYAKVLAYGMTSKQVASLLKKGDASKATGSFDLLASQDGVVIDDDFIVGEVVNPGRVLFDITDESAVWIEARMRPEEADKIKIGAIARINSVNKHWIQGRVIQFHHRLDEITRTRSVRIEVDNNDEELHPGQFVDVAVEIKEGGQILAVPERAVVLMQGNSTIFTVEVDEIHPNVVETGNTRGGWTEIIAGLREGDEIVIQGAFVLKSLLLKSQMGEGHGH